MAKKALKNPPQIPDVLKKIKASIEAGKYIDTSHARERSQARNITLQSALYVLKTGFHEKRKTQFDPLYKCWKYAVRGETLEKQDARIIVAFANATDLMLIITIIDIKKREL